MVVAFAAACFTLLAPWQLGKNSATSERNSLIKSAVATNPVPLAELAPRGAGFTPSTEWREVTVTGSYLPDEQALVRLRAVEERPAIEVLTPFREAGTGRVLVVDRGYVRPDQAGTPAIAAPPSGQTTITARIRAAEGTSDGRGARIEGDVLTMYTVDPAELSAATHTPMDPFYLALSPNQPGSLGEIPLPQLESGPYLSYGLQWLAFGIMAPLGAGYFIVSEIRQRRRAAAQAASADGPSTDPDTTAADRDTTDPAENPANSNSPPSSRAERRKRLRAELRTASGASDGEPAPGAEAAPAGIGVGPDTEHAARDVRSKLTDRYGG